MVLIVLVIILYIFNNGVLKQISCGGIHYFFVCYFNDFLCPLFFVAYCNLLLLLVEKELLKLKWILLLCLSTSLIWEYFAPLLKPTATADMLDILFYLLGGFLYWLILKLNTLKTKEKKQ